MALDTLQTLEQKNQEEEHILSSRIGLIDGVTLVVKPPRRTAIWFFRTQNPKLRPQNSESRTQNSELRTQNSELIYHNSSHNAMELVQYAVRAQRGRQATSDFPSPRDRPAARPSSPASRPLHDIDGSDRGWISAAAPGPERGSRGHRSGARPPSHRVLAGGAGQCAGFARVMQGAQDGLR